MLKIGILRWLYKVVPPKSTYAIYLAQVYGG